jgi:hypothetical protein
MTKLKRADAARKRDALNRQGAGLPTSLAIDARRRLNAASAGTATSTTREVARGASRYAYLSDPHD